ncbi:flagellar filament capping protein FliD [Arcobacter arenosus]|uniref:Flagellar hook-associated protein 2 n=1 Tax=Arcobacter arenosus TaxID=2576037 RepID=A0A5R8XXH1_9BACT|nr:flagellar filament capping protein FliD [Arcobacter arenosus]TLP35867.1 flagellar hook protein FliD [Arcobacter arenosus]
MADGILGLGSSGSLELNSELLEKLRAAEDTAYLDPITEDIEETELEIEAIDTIALKIDELYEVVQYFDLYTSDTNVFDEMTANTSGDSVSFDAADSSDLNPGTVTVSVEQLAKKDVYQSNLITDIEEELIDSDLTIDVGDESYTFDTSGMTYEDLVTEINYISSLEASLEEVGDNSYRLVIKSAESGLANSVTISQGDDLDLGFEEEENHVLTSQNLIATIDGVDYDISSNKVTLSSGLIISAVDEGNSSITITNDDSYVIEAIESLATIYNELVDLVSTYTDGDDDETGVIQDTSSIRSIMSEIKNIFYESYGLEDEESAFFYGISFDEDGYMEVDSDELADALANNYDDLKELFVGYAEKEGLATTLSNYLDDLDSLDGALTTYEDKLDNKLETLEEEYEEESERLDEKYSQMAEQFAAYTVIITEMENAFASLEMIINGDDD